MGFIEREAERIAIALRERAPDSAQYAELYAAQQALKWATEPQGFAAPLDTITRDYSQPATGTLAAPAGCLADSRPAPS